MITDRFSPLSPVSVAQGRHNELIIVQGNGIRPARWDGSGAARDAGIDAPDKPLDVAYGGLPDEMDESDLPHPVKPLPGPTEVPSTGSTVGRITVSPTRHFYVARTDVYKQGNVYYAPPEVSYSTEQPIDNGRGREAKAKSYLNQSAVTEIRMDDGGKYYPTAPSVTLSDSHGKGAVLTAILDAPEVILQPGNSAETGITGYQELTTTPWEDEIAYFEGDKTRYGIYRFVDIPLENGEFDLPGPWFWHGYQDSCGTWRNYPIAPRVQGSVSGITSGEGAVLRVNGSGWAFGGAECGEPRYNATGGCSSSCYITYWLSSGVASAVARKFGEGYNAEDDIIVRIRGLGTVDPATGRWTRPSPPEKDIIIRAFQGADPGNPSGDPYPLKDIRIDDPGSGYLVAPDLQIISQSGFGAYATCEVEDGKIAKVTLENPGGGYTTRPEVRILAGGAEAFAVARPHLRGAYQCFYRYIDDTPEEKGGPLPSNVSPVVEVDCGEGATSLTWNVPSPTGRAKRVELWRSTSNQALTLYRVATLSGGNQHLDDLTDDELRDPDRDGYEAMPFVLPNGEINAMRFSPPPDDKAAVVRFQDRFWYGVDTSGNEVNAVYFSEVDEPESVPRENQLILQQNARDADGVTALIPFGPTLVVAQSRHAYTLTFSQQPLLDAQVTPIGYRGSANQRCWEIYDGVCYVMDQYGLYAMSPSGQIEPLSDPIENWFRDNAVLGKWSFVSVDPHAKVLRAFITVRGEGGAGYPTAAICMSLDARSWWLERYPHRITAGTNARISNGDFRCIYGAQGGAYILNEGSSDAGRGSIHTVTLTNRGSGYRSPPAITAEGGAAGAFEANLDGDGRISAIWITNAGHNYESGSLYIGPPDDPNGVQAEAVFTATPLDEDYPLFPVYRFKTGNVPYPTDADDPKLGGDMPRSVDVTYQPQPSACITSLRTYYNNSSHPRHNAATRDRGTGFVSDLVDSASRLDMGKNTVDFGTDSGVATAEFSGRSLGDLRSTDRHVAVEFVGARANDVPVVIYDVTMFGAG